MVGLSENIKTKRKKLSEAKSKKVMVHMWIQDNICFVMTVTYLWLVPWVNGLDVVVRLEQHLWGLWTERVSETSLVTLWGSLLDHVVGESVVGVVTGDRVGDSVGSGVIGLSSNPSSSAQTTPLQANAASSAVAALLAHACQDAYPAS